MIFKWICQNDNRKTKRFQFFLTYPLTQSMEKEQVETTNLEEVLYTTTSQNPKLLKLDPDMKSKSINTFLYVSTAIANLITLVVGISLAWTSPVLPKLKESVDNPIGRPITPSEESWIAALLPLAAIFGPIGAGRMADKFGRKKTLLILSCPMGVSLVLSAFAQSVPLFCIARFLMGAGVGSVYTVLPVYLSEIAEDHNRGTVGCIFSVFIVIGLFISYAMGPFLSIRNFCLICATPLLVFAPVFLIFVPESPQYLAMINDQKALEASLLKFRNKPRVEIQKEMEDITRSAQDNTQNQAGLKNLFATKANRKGVIITIGLILLQQFAGINAVLAYMQTIFDAAGSGLAPEISAIIIAAVQVFIVMGASSLVDRLGRRILLLVSLTGSGFSLVALGVYFYLKDNDVRVDSISWLPVTSLLIFIISFNSGLSSLPWAIVGELFPASLKAVASTMNSVTCFIACFLITFFFPSLSLELGMAVSFWFFAVIIFVGLVFVYWLVPETKGKSLQEIQRLLEGSK